MTRVKAKELKSINNVEFLPQHYLVGALPDDAKGLGRDGKTISDMRKELQKQLALLADETTTQGVSIETRDEIISHWFKTLGFYEINGDSKYDFPVKVNTKEYVFQVERVLNLKAEGQLWLVRDNLAGLATEPTDENADDSEEADLASVKQGEVEHFYQKPVKLKHKTAEATLPWKKLLDELFNGDSCSCEWMVIHQGDRVILLERGKWQEFHAYLEVDLTELFNVNDKIEYSIVDVLFSTGAFALSSAESYLDQVEQNSHKKAAEVTKALRDTVRESIEIIGNQILENHYAKSLPSLADCDFDTKEGRDEAAKKIFDQTLRYVYRALFMLYAESQEQRKGALPVQSKPYQMGYAMEKLRELENIPIANVDGSSNFIQMTLDRATRIYFEGYNTDRVLEHDEHTGDAHLKTDGLGFSFPQLGTDLFDRAKTPLFQEAELADGAMQQVVRKLSLAQVGTGKKRKTYRVHYAGLGLNQLGAVYEGLLSLKPEVLAEDAILLKRDKKDPAHRFVPAKDQSKFDKKLFEIGEDKKPLHRKKGSFLLTPVGLERKFSASFYTPEVLTRFLAKEAVDTLLGDKPELDRMLNLKICEPAMGSGAFLNAVVDEIAPKIATYYRKEAEKEFEEYATERERKNLEIDKSLAPRDMSYYISKAKHHLMQKCVFGVDLNKTAVELAKVSLWLNCLHEDGNLPFLDFKLKHGNSLVGGWVKRHFHEGTNWPHFLVPNPKALDAHLKGKVLGLKDWPFIEDEAQKEKLKEIQSGWAKVATDKKYRARLDALAKKVEKLYGEHLDQLSDYRHRMAEAESVVEKREIFEGFRREASAYNQLRSMLDYWCALWFWPHSDIANVPTADKFLQGLEWMAEIKLAYGGEDRVQQIKGSGLKELIVAREVALNACFFHWDLEYADVFNDGGFDLVLGNPPWAPVRWEEAEFFELHVPGIHSVKESSKEKQKRYKSILISDESSVSQYKEAVVKMSNTSVFLKSSNTYPMEDKSSTNTYRYFYQRFFELAATRGIHAMIAQDGILTDKGCAMMRPTFYSELVRGYRFVNEFKLFEDIGNLTFFMVWISEKNDSKFSFTLIDNLYLPEMVRSCRNESSHAPYPGMKTSEGKFETRGHPDRIVNIDREKMQHLSSFDPGMGWDSVKLPIIHGRPELGVLTQLASHGSKISTSNWGYWRRFDESGAPKAGLITRDPGKSKSIEVACLTGPNIQVGTPANKIPNPGCKNHRDFSPVDLTQVPDDYFPDTVYQTTAKGLKSPEYLSKTPWGTVHSQEPRIIARQMVSTTGARTLSSALIPPGPSHVHSMASLSFKDHRELIYTSGLFHSLIFDFLMRSISGGTIGQGIYEMTPTLTPEQKKHPLVPALMIRALRLSCISSHYADLWKEVFTEDMKVYSVASPFQPELSYSRLSKKWVRNSCIRDPKQREQALCEIDAIVAILFDFDKDTLLNLYRSQFGVLQKNLEDLPSQEALSEKHFPRYQQMEEAYKQLKDINADPKEAA